MKQGEMLLTLNCGSATLKWALFDGRGRSFASGLVERIGQPRSFHQWQWNGRKRRQQVLVRNHTDALQTVRETFSQFRTDPHRISLVAHRVVHGGPASTPERITFKVFAGIIRRSNLAPLHHPPQIAGIQAAHRRFPRAQHFAVYDTLFFRNMPNRAAAYGLPLREAKRQGIRRYGFHGLSHASVAREAARRLHRPLRTLNLLTVHLGSGASIAALERGKPIDTSMGMTPLEGLVMGTRAGDLDPGILLFLLQSRRLSSRSLADLLTTRSGLLGLTSGFSSDMRDILVAAGYTVPGWRVARRVTPKTRQQCRAALEVFTYRVQKYLGAYATILGRVDAVVFTGGIGERSAPVRRMILANVPAFRRFRVLVVPSDEEGMMAQLIRKTGR